MLPSPSRPAFSPLSAGREKVDPEDKGVAKCDTPSGTAAPACSPLRHGLPFLPSQSVASLLPAPPQGEPSVSPWL